MATSKLMNPMTDADPSNVEGGTCRGIRGRGGLRGPFSNADITLVSRPRPVTSGFQPDFRERGLRLIELRDGKDASKLM
jgi:hypothetical protein